MMKIFSFKSWLAIFVSGIFFTSIQAQAQTTVRLKDNWGGNYLTASSKADWSQVRSQTKNNGWDSQKWIEEQVSTNVFRYKNKWSGDYLSATSDSGWTNVATAPLNTSWGSQKWVKETAGNQIRLKDQWGGNYLNVSGDSSGSDVVVAPKNNSWGSMKWSRESVSGGNNDTPSNNGSRGVGSDIQPSGTIRNVYPGDNIKNIIANAANNTTIHFNEGTYYNVKDIGIDNKKIILDGEPGVVFDGQYHDQGIILYENADNSIIQDIHFKNYKRAIHVPGADNVKLRNLKFTNMGNDTGSTTDNTTYGIQIDNSNNSVVDRSEFKNCRQKCVGVGYGRDVDIKNSIFEDVNTGYYYNANWNVGAIKYFAASGFITNVKTNNVKGNAIWIDTARYVKVSKSESFNNDDAGIYIEKCPTTQVFDNNVNKIIMTQWSTQNGASQWNNNVGNTQEPDYWNCGSFNCSDDERTCPCPAAGVVAS